MTLEEYRLKFGVLSGSDTKHVLNESGLKNAYKHYKKLSEEDKAAVIELKKLEGSSMYVFYYGKWIKCILEFVATEEQTTNGVFGAYPYDIRVNWDDKVNRNWDGVWITDLKRIKQSL